MYEQDIELTRLLLTKLTELDARGESLRAEISQCQTELDSSQSVRSEREQYLDVLTRAAQLLDRADLEVESPQLSELEQRMEELKGRLGALDEEVQQYRTLVDELRERAPGLLEAATGDSAPAEPAALEAVDDEEFEPEEEPGGNYEGYATTDPEPEAEEEAPFAEAAAAGDEAGEAAEPAVLEIAPAAAVEFAASAVAVEALGEEQPATAAVAGYEPETALDQLFDIKDLKVKEAFAYGLGAAYIVDATSVLDRVPNYDQHFRALQADQVRDELVRDLDRLSREISGDFYVVFDAAHHATVSTGTHVFVEYVEGNGSKDATNERISELVAQMNEQERIACVVTGDSGLAEDVADDNVYVIPLGNFFNT
jgi:hypothetical protein